MPLWYFCSGLRYYPNSYLKSLNSTTSEETSAGPSEYVKAEPDGVVSVVDVQSVEKNEYKETESDKEDSSVDGQTKSVEKNDYKETESDKEDSSVDGQTNPFEFLDNLNLKVYF